MTEENEKAMAARIRAEESIEYGIRSELRHTLYSRKDIVAACVHQGIVQPFTEAACRKLLKAGKSDAEVGEVFGMTPWEVLCWRRRHMPGLRKEKKEEMPQNNKLDEEKVMELYREGKSDGAIGKVLGVTSNAILMWRRRNQLPANFSHGHKPGEAAPATGENQPVAPQSEAAAPQESALPVHCPADQPDRAEELEGSTGGAAIKALSGEEIDEVLAHAGEVMKKAMPAPQEAAEPADIKDMISEANCLAMKVYNIAPALIAVMLTREEIDLLQQLIRGEVETGDVSFEALRKYMSIYESLQKTKDRYGKDG